jgi:hypothetical protein
MSLFLVLYSPEITVYRYTYPSRTSEGQLGCDDTRQIIGGGMYDCTQPCRIVFFS